MVESQRVKVVVIWHSTESGPTDDSYGTTPYNFPFIYSLEYLSWDHKNPIPMLVIPVPQLLMLVMHQESHFRSRVPMLMTRSHACRLSIDVHAS